jgi:hypothetical protein
MGNMAGSDQNYPSSAPMAIWHVCIRRINQPMYPYGSIGMYQCLSVRINWHVCNVTWCIQGQPKLPSANQPWHWQQGFAQCRLVPTSQQYNTVLLLYYVLLRMIQIVNISWLVNLRGGVADVIEVATRQPLDLRQWECMHACLFFLTSGFVFLLISVVWVDRRLGFSLTVPSGVVIA